MTSSADSALMATSAGALGAWFGAFIVPMAVAYVLLRLAGSAKRKPGTAIALRLLALVMATLFAYLGYIGSGGWVNPGGLLAVAVTAAWAIWQQSRRAPA